MSGENKSVLADSSTRSESRQNTKSTSHPDPRYILVLRVACTLGAGGSFTKEDLTIACWDAHPKEFGLAASDGVSRPNSSAVNSTINSAIGLVARGMLDWESPGVLSVTDRGRKHGEEPTVIPSGLKPGRKKKPVVECGWCCEPATVADEDGDPACRKCKSEMSAKRARNKRARVAVSRSSE